MKPPVFRWFVNVYGDGGLEAWMRSQREVVRNEGSEGRMIKYLVCGTDVGGVADARSRGWVQLAAMRFATPGKDDVRVVRRFADMVPDRTGVTVLVRGRDFPEEPVEGSDAGDFEAFVAAGHGRWE